MCLMSFFFFLHIFLKFIIEFVKFTFRHKFNNEFTHLLYIDLKKKKKSEKMKLNISNGRMFFFFFSFFFYR